MTTPEQDVLITKWVAALRSGDYQQHKGGDLCRDGEYCCLGVAGKLIGLSDDMLTGKYTGDFQRGAYEIVQDTFGLSTSLGHFAGTNLAYLNDTTKSFTEIADIIESRPKGLFK